MWAVVSLVNTPTTLAKGVFTKETTVYKPQLEMQEKQK